MRMRGRRKAHPIWKYFSDSKESGRVVTKCLNCEFTTPARTQPVMKAHYRANHNRGNPSLYAQLLQESALYKQKNKDNHPESAMKTSSEDVAPTAAGKSKKTEVKVEPEASTSKGSSPCTKSLKPEMLRNSSTPEPNMPETPVQLAVPIKSESIAEPSSSPCLSLPENLLNMFQEAAAGRKNTNFSLSSGIADLLEVTQEYKLKFIFDTRGGSEYCLSKEESSVMLAIVDCGNEIAVKVKRGNSVIEEVRWMKADWDQFLWAIRGKCSKIFDVVVID
uniref:BED-type domain-containing protein n=1 Tax=Panagrolaimus sp. JU765 TaxID=591449 RepID=A0AC34PVV6_9BILA